MKIKLAAGLTIIGVLGIMIAAYADAFSGLVIGTGSTIAGVLRYTVDPGAVYFENSGEVSAFEDMLVMGDGLEIWSDDDALMSADAGASVIGQELTSTATRGMTLGYAEEGFLFWKQPYDCPDEMTEGEECVEDLQVFYMGEVEGESPDALRGVSILAGHGDLALASIDGLFQDRAAVVVSEDGSASMQSDIASDEGDRGVDPRAKITCTRDGDVIIRLGGEASSSFSSSFTSSSTSTSVASGVAGNAPGQVKALLELDPPESVAGQN